MKRKSYEMEELSSASFSIDLEGESDDIYILSASFEERGTVIATHLRDDYRCRSCIIYYNEDNSNYAENLKLLKKTMKSKSLTEVITVEGSHRDSKKKNEAMIRIAEGCRKQKGENVTNVVIDITGFTKIDLIILLDFLTSYVENVRIKLLYVSPEEHGDWLSKGHSGICNIPGFCGNYDALKSTVLIILSGFEKDRSKNLIEEFEPQEVYLGLSDPAVQEKFGVINADIQSELLEYSNVHSFKFSAKEMSACFQTICDLVEMKINDFNVVIAPLCTKLSAVACFKVAKKHPDVQLVYCFPQKYNYERYSVGSRKMFVEYMD